MDNSIDDVDVCEVLKGPRSYDTKAIRFRGRLNFEFEGNDVDDETCKLPLLHTGVWWDYGGEGVSASKGEASRIQELITPIIRDANSAEFEDRVYAHRAKRPDGEPCYSHRACAYYDVTATFTGRFFAARLTTGRRGPTGHGHRGCCHLFVIEQIADVDATRTLVPSDDFRQPTPDVEGPLAANKEFLAEQMTVHGDQTLIEDMNQKLSPFSDLTGFLTWSSPDLLTTYKVRFLQTNVKGKPKRDGIPTTTPLSVEVIRESCEQLEY